MGLSYGSCMVRVGSMYWRAVVPERLLAVVGRKESAEVSGKPYARESRLKVGYLNARLLVVLGCLLLDKCLMTPNLCQASWLARSRSFLVMLAQSCCATLSMPK